MAFSKSFASRCIVVIVNRGKQLVEEIEIAALLVLLVCRLSLFVVEHRSPPSLMLALFISLFSLHKAERACGLLA